jgi:hypothetical protein
LHPFLKFSCDHVRGVPVDVQEGATDEEWVEHLRRVGMNEDAIDSIMPNEEDDEIIRDFIYWDTAAGNAEFCLLGEFG